MKQKLFFTLIILISCIWTADLNAQRRSQQKSSKSTTSTTSKSRSSRSKSSRDSKRDSEAKSLYNIFWGSFVDFGARSGSLTYRKDQVYNPSTGNTEERFNLTNAGQLTGYYSPFFLGFHYRYLVKNFSKESSLSVEGSPSLSVTFGSGGDEAFAGGFVLPLTMSYNLGAMSTNSSRKDGGFGFGLGAEYNNFGLIDLSSLGSNPFNEIKVGKPSMILPVATISRRYYNTNDAGREWMLKVGYWPSTQYEDKYGTAGQLENPYNTNSNRNDSPLEFPGLSVRLSLGYYFNN